MHNPQLPPQLCGFSAHTENSPHISSTLSPLWPWCPVTLSLVSFSPLQSANIPDALCDEDTDCLEGKAVVAGNGKGSVPVCAVSGVLQRPQPGYTPSSLITEGTKAFLFFPVFFLRSLPCLQLCGGWAREPRAAQRHNKRVFVPAERGPFTAGRRGRILYFHVPCRQGGEVTAWCDLFCDVCSQGLRLAVV